MAEILDGKKLSTEIRGEVKQDIVKLKENGIVPGLAGILVGQNEGSATYVRLKEKAAEALGIHSQAVRLPEDTTEEQLLKQIDKLNLDSKIHGIFIQLPLPKHINENRALNAVLPEKDVDGFHPMNVGKAWLGQEAFLPATPDGIRETHGVHSCSRKCGSKCDSLSPFYSKLVRLYSPSRYISCFSE